MGPMTERFEMRLDEETVQRVDRWRRGQVDVPSRAEAIRRLIDVGLAKASGKGVTFTDGEKLLMLMMRDLYRRLNPKDAEIDPDFIAEVIYGGHYWAADWQLTGVFHGHEDDPRLVSFVVDVLDMWNFIERGFERLSAADRTTVETETGRKQVEFPGFDGNNEAEQLGIAHFLIEKLNRFTRFAGRELNSHWPTHDEYSRMLRVFEPIRAQLHGDDLNAAQITAVLLAKGEAQARRQA